LNNAKDIIVFFFILVNRKRYYNILNMKDNLIEILDIAGTPTICYDVDSVDNVCRLYPGQLLTITNKSMQVYQDNPTNLNESD
jgi:hypothetical protein